MVVTNARRPAFYADYGVPDTLNGRYEMLASTTFTVLERLRAEGGGVEELSRQTLENLFTDVDDNMREFGVGDLTVPKKVRRAAAGFYERALAYRPPLEAGDVEALAAALAHFVQQRATADAGMRALAGHMLAERRALAAVSVEAMLAGGGFVPPASINSANTASVGKSAEGAQ